MIADPSRSLENCPLVIFIAYTVGADAEAKGYSRWLQQVDMPFFNAIPGTRHYANWRLTRVLHGRRPFWDYFDFQGLETEQHLKSVWFDPSLDEFRANWLRLWGYGGGTPPDVLRHAYVMRPIRLPDVRRKDDRLVLAGGRGHPPAGHAADIVFRVESILHKHFGSDGQDGPWLSSAGRFNPLGLDWLSVTYGISRPADIPVADLVAEASLIAAPDRQIAPDD